MAGYTYVKNSFYIETSGDLLNDDIGFSKYLHGGTFESKEDFENAINLNHEINHYVQELFINGCVTEGLIINYLAALARELSRNDAVCFPLAEPNNMRHNNHLILRERMLKGSNPFMKRTKFTIRTMVKGKLKKGDQIYDSPDFISGLSFYSDERGISIQGNPLLEKLSIHPIGEGMLWIGESHGPLFFANSQTGKARQLLDETSHLVGFEERDFDWDKLKTVEHPYDVNHKYVDYGGLGRYWDFSDGICCLCWMLHPDGRYYADEDGFGMEDDEEENIYCIIDSNLRIIIPWQPMTDGEMAEKMREARERIK